MGDSWVIPSVTSLTERSVGFLYFSITLLLNFEYFTLQVLELGNMKL